jgi:hypothetical protein
VTRGYRAPPTHPFPGSPDSNIAQKLTTSILSFTYDRQPPSTTQKPHSISLAIKTPCMLIKRHVGPFITPCIMARTNIFNPRDHTSSTVHFAGAFNMSTTSAASDPFAYYSCVKVYISTCSFLTLSVKVLWNIRLYSVWSKLKFACESERYI